MSGRMRCKPNGQVAAVKDDKLGLEQDVSINLK